jgi:hypothetical protein
VQARDDGQQAAMEVLDLPRFEGALAQLRPKYASSEPFQHIVLDNFLLPEVARRAIDEFGAVDPESWINYLHVNERKLANRDIEAWGLTLRAVAQRLNSPDFVRALGELTGISDLHVDETLHGGGLHESMPGGFLNIHADFTVHPEHRHWRRRVNLLLYFNEDWPAHYGGDLELWSRDMKQCVETVAPLANRAVIFNTDPDAFHGHPEPLRCPPGTARWSLALYYYTVEDNPQVRATHYRPRPREGPRAALIYLDNLALRVFDRVKRLLGVSDQAAGRVLKSLHRTRRETRNHRTG